jgi:hypothetical protein
MLTILHDQHEIDGRTVEIATCEGFTKIAPRRATCELAQTLIKNGFGSTEAVRIVRADPYLFGPPHRVEGLSLSTATILDVFGDLDDSDPEVGFNLLTSTTVDPDES